MTRHQRIVVFVTLLLMLFAAAIARGQAIEPSQHIRAYADRPFAPRTRPNAPIDTPADTGGLSAHDTLAAVAVDAIRDNSFLVEEAYNQDPRTVQHISTFAHDVHGGDWNYSFTQEWPFRGQHQQLSVTIPLARVDGLPRAAWGVRDVAVNYRYQLAGVDGGAIAVAPRFSLVTPTGRTSAGLGSGAYGAQVMLPVSIALGTAFVTHVNAGVTHTGASGTSVSSTTWNLAHSLVWLAAQRVNLLLETAWSSTTTPNETDGGQHAARTLVVSPGVRWSHNLPGHLQIVPGVAVPIGVGPSAGDRAVLLYLSFEHPY